MHAKNHTRNDAMDEAYSELIDEKGNVTLDIVGTHDREQRSGIDSAR